jgi:hypothetical protein
MFAGSICEDTDCTGLVLMLLALAAAALVIALLVALAWAAVIAGLLRRRGWGAAARRTTAVVAVFIASRVLYEVALALPDIRTLLLWLVVAPPVPLLIWQRRVARRQSSPCSTA